MERWGWGVLRPVFSDEEFWYICVIYTGEKENVNTRDSCGEVRPKTSPTNGKGLFFFPPYVGKQFVNPPSLPYPLHLLPS